MKPAFLRPAANFIPNLRNGRANELLNYSVASRKVGGGKNGLGWKGRQRERGGTPGVGPKFSNGERNDGGWRRRVELRKSHKEPARRVQKTNGEGGKGKRVR